MCLTLILDSDDRVGQQNPIVKLLPTLCKWLLLTVHLLGELAMLK